MNNFKKVLTALVIGGVVVSTSVISFAAETNNVNNIPSASSRKIHRAKDIRQGFFGKGEMKNIEENLKVLVSSGILTQDESDKILALSKQESEVRQAEMDKVKNMTEEERKAYFESKKEQPSVKKGDIFASSVSGGIITQEKADSAKAKLQETRAAERKTKLAEGLSRLVSSGTITQEQSDKISAYVNNLDSTKVAKDTNSTTAAKGEKKNPLLALVDDGTLTQAQLDEVSKVLPMSGGRGHGGHRGNSMNKPVKTSTNTATTTTSN